MAREVRCGPAGSRRSAYIGRDARSLLIPSGRCGSSCPIRRAAHRMRSPAYWAQKLAETLGPAVRHRQSSGRRGLARTGDRREGDAGRVHAAGRRFAAHHQRARAEARAVRPDQGLHADHAARDRAAGFHRASRLPCAHGEGVRRRGAEPAGQAQLRLGRRGLHHLPHRRAVQARDARRYRAHPVQEHRACVGGRDGRAGAGGLSRPLPASSPTCAPAGCARWQSPG